MKKVKAITEWVNPEVHEDYYLLTDKEVEMLNNGELTFYGGNFYRTKDVPREVEVTDFGVNLFPLDIYGDAKPKMPQLTISNRDFSQEYFHPVFNRPTQAQIERMRKIPDFPKIKGVHLKNSNITPETQSAIRGIIEFLHTAQGKHPFEAVRTAQMHAEVAGTDDARRIMLNLLNAYIPLKEGMKLEGFSAKEFDEKFLYSQPSLLEQATKDLDPRPADKDDVSLGDPTYLSVELEGMENSHIKELDAILKETFSPGHPATPDLIVHQNVAANMYWTGYVGTIRNGNDNCFETNWELALHLQKVNWSIFRGKTISIIRLFNKISNPNDKDLDLTTPIEGMKKH